MLIFDIEGITNSEYEKRLFASLGADYMQKDCGGQDDEIIAKAGAAQVILFSATKITSGLIDKLPSLKLLVRYGTGFDNVDLEYARKRGIKVCNAPHYGSYDVAEHAFTLIMSVNRKIAVYDRKIRAGQFGASADYNPVRLEEKTLGLVGFGRIARNVLRFALGFNMKVIVYDPYVKESEIMSQGAIATDFETLLAESDFISIHSPLTEQTKRMFSDEAFVKMKNSAVLINTSRGGIIDEKALARALEKRLIRAAGIDVYEVYPKSAEYPLASLDNIILTPHVAWDSEESNVALHEEVADEVARFFKGEPLKNVVN